MRKRVLILGCTGMIGHTLFTKLSERDTIDIFGTCRESLGLREWFGPDLMIKIRSGVDSNNIDSIVGAMVSTEPDVVVNCLGMIKQLPLDENPQDVIATNALLPHRVAMVCNIAGVRMIHLSTDCVFRGDKGNYIETDVADATDLYGRTKYLGEVSSPNCLTLRMSTVGHELRGNRGLLEWFLAQDKQVRGYKNMLFSGISTIEVARVIDEYVLPNAQLTGIYHVSSSAISKYDFLKAIAEKYQKKIMIEPDESVMIDRTLDSSRFRSVTGYQPPTWEKMIDDMYWDFSRSRHGES